MTKNYSFLLPVFFLLATPIAKAQNWSLTGNNNAAESSKLGTTTSTPLRLFTNNEQRAIIASNGHFGIGINKPIYPLHVSSSTALTTIYGINTLVGNTQAVGVYGYSARYGLKGNGGYTGVHGNGEGGNSLAAWGVYGYATGSTGYRFGIEGRVLGGEYTYGIYGIAQGGNPIAGYFDGKVFAHSFHGFSDRKFKTDVMLLENSLEQVMKLRPASYLFKADNFKSMQLSREKQLGLIADELKQVFPELVSPAVHPPEFDVNDQTRIITPEVQYEAINYIGLIPVLIASVQELKNENDDLKKELAELKTLVNKLSLIQKINTTATDLALLQNTPNPAKGTTTIRYALPEGITRAQLLITDASGRTINTVQLTASGQINMDLSALSSGTYNYSLMIEGRLVQTRKMTVEK